jgi:hypothetical protein
MVRHSCWKSFQPSLCSSYIGGHVCVAEAA